MAGDFDNDAGMGVKRMEDDKHRARKVKAKHTVRRKANASAAPRAPTPLTGRLNRARRRSHEGEAEEVGKLAKSKRRNTKLKKALDKGLKLRRGDGRRCSVSGASTRQASASVLSQPGILEQVIGTPAVGCRGTPSRTTDRTVAVWQV